MAKKKVMKTVSVPTLQEVYYFRVKHKVLNDQNNVFL